MKVLLIDPRAPSFGLNVALGYISASLKKNGIEVRTLDLNNRRHINKWEDIIAIVEEYRPDLIGFSVLYVSLKRVYEYARAIKGRLKTNIILGGPQIAIEQKHALLDCDAVDFALVGEGEHRLPELCRALAGELNYSDIGGLIYRDNSELRQNPMSAPWKDVDVLPFPDYESFGIQRIEEYPLMSSRGCPYDCSYCFRQFGRDWRPRSPDNIIAELKEARERYNIKRFVVHDDSFNIDKRRVIHFCEQLLSRDFKMDWSCAGVRADAVDDELASMMARAGCRSVAIGVETLDPEIFKGINKRETVEDVIGAIDAFKKTDMRVLGYFIIGLPGDTYKGVLRTYKNAKRLKLDDMSWSLLLPIPQTRMYEDIYRDPKFRILNNYKDIDMVWLRELSEVKVAFDHPSFTEHEKLNAYYKINTKIGHLWPRLDRPSVFVLLESFFMILRHAPQRLPIYVMRTVGKIIGRLAKGSALIKMLAIKNENLQYRKGFLLPDCLSNICDL